MKFKVLIITPGFAQNQQDTSCIPALQDLMLGLARLPNFEFKILALHFPQSDEYLWHGIHVKSIGKDNPKRLKKILALRKFSSTIKNEITVFKPNLLHGFWLTDAGYSAALIGKKLNIPTLLTAMGQDVSPTFYTQQIYKWKTPVVAISEFQKKHLQKMGIEPQEVIPHGLPKITANNSIKEFDIICVGSLIPVKRPLFALECLQAIIQKQPQLRAAFIGDGPLRNDMVRFVRENQLTYNVKFLGHLSREESFKNMEKARILLHTARFEGYGLVIAEALALGLHVVSTPVGIAPETANIKLFNNKKEGVAQLEKALTQNAVSSRPFQIENTVKAYRDLYIRLLES